jgi:hypothetical protein
MSSELRAYGASFALVGGLAVSARTEPRFTRDVDLAVRVDTDSDAEALIRALLTRGWTVLSQIEQEATGRLATVRLAPPAGGPASGIVVDLLFASSGVEPEVISAAEPLEVLEGVLVPVATTPHLLALKVLSNDPARRPQDLIDAIGLLASASAADLAEVRRLLLRIEDRGFHRGKALIREFEALLDSA